MDAWHMASYQMISSLEVMQKFGLMVVELRHWTVLSHQIVETWQNLLLLQAPIQQADDWFRVYIPGQRGLPAVVIQGKDLPHHALRTPATTVFLQDVEQVYLVQPRLHTLMEVTHLKDNLPLSLTGSVFPIRVICTT